MPTAPSAGDIEALQGRLAEAGVHTLLVQFTDVHGSAKGKWLPLHQLKAVLSEGAGFAGPSIWGTGPAPHRPTRRVLCTR